jgi:hypothetical protein
MRGREQRCIVDLALVRTRRADIRDECARLKPFAAYHRFGCARCEHDDVCIGSLISIDNSSVEIEHGQIAQAGRKLQAHVDRPDLL